MHFLHIYNCCQITDFSADRDHCEKYYFTSDHTIKLKQVIRAPEALYHLTVAKKLKDAFVLGKAQSLAGRTVFECDCFVTAENDKVLCMCGLDGKKERYKIVIQKSFSF